VKVVFLCLVLLSTVLCQGGVERCVRHMVVPGYPRVARMARLEGIVNVQVEIRADGKVISATGSGANDLLNRASEENVREWLFGRDFHEGISKQTITYIYKLQGKEEYYDSSPVVVLDLPCRVEITGHPPQPQP